MDGKETRTTKMKNTTTGKAKEYEVEKYDGFILTETHLNDDEEKNEIEKFETHFKDLEEDLHVCGVYAPAGTAVARKTWMKKVGEVFEKKKGFKVMAGDFNCVTNTRLDKIGGNKKKGTEGAEEQRVCQPRNCGNDMDE